VGKESEEKKRAHGDWKSATMKGRTRNAKQLSIELSRS
jgi:hypothetical protein